MKSRRVSGVNKTKLAQGMVGIGARIAASASPADKPAIHRGAEALSMRLLN